MSTTIATIVLVLGGVLAGVGAAIRLGVVELVPGFQPDATLAKQVARGGTPVVLAGVLSLVAGAIEWTSPLPKVGWLGYTLAVLGLVFFGGARAGGS